ncbi:MAG: stage II sporulation protein D, partial [Bacilli bacterium]|nr:stage II sporulation protein D [Bacilli bacterium]
AKNKTNVSSSTTSQNQIKSENVSSTEEVKTPIQEKPSEPQPELQPQEQKITIYRSNGTTLVISMTDYLIGVVAAEMPASFPIEALKAQAVVARTYALKRLASGGRLTDDVSTQVYRDESYLRSTWKKDYDMYYNKIKSAVQATEDLTVKYRGSYIEAIYHSTSNGKTEDAVHVWGNSVPYLKSVDSSWDQSASTYLRTVEQELTTVFQILGIQFQEPVSIEILSRNESGRISNIRVGDQNYTGVEFRALLGLRSSDFDLEVRDGKLIITTRGYGHGVGMSQYGAKGMAENGYSYSQILAHYYPGTTLSKG